MTIQDWGAIGEAVGGLAIIISLFYVGVQIRQSTRANRSATTQSFIEAFVHPSEQLVSSDFIDVYSRGLDGLGQLKRSEQIEFTVWCMNTFRLWESCYFLWKSGDFDSDIWRGFQRQLSDLYSYQGVRDFWDVRNHHFSDEFQELVGGMTVEASSAGMYGENMSRSA